MNNPNKQDKKEPIMLHITVANWDEGGFAASWYDPTVDRWRRSPGFKTEQVAMEWTMDYKKGLVSFP